MSTVTILVLLILFVVFLRHLIIRKRHPPGPLGLPFVGILPFKIIQIVFERFIPPESPAKYFRDMKETYGGIWSLEIGRQRIVTLASLDLLNEAFVDNATLFSGRPSGESYNILAENCGILFTDGETWKQNRQLAIKSLRDLGMGKRDLEVSVCDEADLLIEHLQKVASSPIKSSEAFVMAVSNVISRLVFNERNQYNDPEFEKYVGYLKPISHSDVAFNLMNLSPKFFQTPLARYLFPKVDEFLNCYTNVMKFIREKCVSRIKLEKTDCSPSCVFDFFWQFRYQNSPEIEYENKFRDVSHSMIDLYNAGTDTTTNTLQFSCLMLGMNEDVQEDLRNEIQVLTKDYTRINMNMRKDCPKLLSFIDEVQRYCFLVPKTMRRALERCVLRGYQIEPNDIIFGDLSTISRDSTLFENPDVFDAYRFMDSSRTKYIPNKNHIPFGIGKRSCVGESIAKMELFLFLSRIILIFEVSLPKETRDNFDKILEGQSGIVHVPLDHKICFKMKE